MYLLHTIPKAHKNTFREKLCIAQKYFYHSYRFSLSSFSSYKFEALSYKVSDAVHPHIVSEIPLYMTFCAKLYLTQLYATNVVM